MSSDASSGPMTLPGLVFDPLACTITVSGRRTPLDRRSSAVFGALAGRPGRAVAKDALLAQAWPDQLVHENSLAKSISKLRRAIEGSGVEIAAYGVGYVLRDREAADPVPASPVPEATPAPAPSRRWRGWHVAAPATLAAAVAAGLLLFAPAGRSGSAPAPAPVLHDAPDVVARVLWVDDHPTNNAAEVAYLRTRRVGVHLAESTDDALKLLAMNSYQLVVSDLGRGEDRLAGLKMVEVMRTRGMAVPVLIYTVRASSPAGQAAQQQMVTRAAGADLAVTPAEVRRKILARLELSPS